MNTELVARLLEKVEGRFYGKYRAVVVDNADPEQRGRLRLRVPSVLGAEIVSGWALPCAPYGGAAEQGFFFIPEVNATVWVEFEAGDLDYPIWVGAFWGKPGGASDVPKPAQSPPTRKILRTVKGSSIEIEDKDGSEVFILQFHDGKKKNTVTMNKDGVFIEDAGHEQQNEGGKKNTIKLTSEGIVIEELAGGKQQNTITLAPTEIVLENTGDSGQNVIRLNDSGITIQDKNGNAILLRGSSLTLKSQVLLGEGATEPMVLGTQLKTALTNWVNTVFATHTHPTTAPGAPTLVPTPASPLVLDLALSQLHKVK